MENFGVEYESLCSKSVLLKLERSNIISNFRSHALFRWDFYTNLCDVVSVNLIRIPCIFAHNFECSIYNKKKVSVQD